MKSNRNLLIIGSVWPEPDSSAAGRRMLQLIELFRSDGWHIIFASSAAKTEYSAMLSNYGVKQAEIEINSSQADKFLADLQPSAVMYDRFIIEEQFGWRVAEQCPRAVSILDTEDLHSLRRARHEALKEGRKFSKDELLNHDTTKREMASIYRSDLSLIISEYELQLLTDFFDIDESLLSYVPFILDSIDDKQTKRWPAFSERNHFVTIGNFQHEPNWDAVKFLVESIWPEIRSQLPEAELHVYGAYPTQQARQLHQPENGFFIKGRAEDAGKVVRQARVFLAPLRFGAGLKGKLVEAMQCGTPSVTTSIGAEGIAGNLEWSGTVADSVPDVVEAAVSLYKDKLKWDGAQQQGIKIIKRRFATRSFGQSLMKRIKNLQDNLNTHRSSNFIGAMLRHHTAASTKYMAKWIEEKNRD